MVKISRKGDAGRPMYIDHSFVGVLGGTQPGRLSDFADAKKAVNGFLARLLFSYPDTTTKPGYSNRVPDPQFAEHWSAIVHQLAGLPLRSKPPKDEFDDWTLDPIPLDLSSEALKLYREFYDEIAREVNESEDEIEQAILTKYDSHVLRIALVLHYLDWATQYDEWDGVPDADQIAEQRISGTVMARAIRAARYFRHTSLKVVGRLSSPAEGLPATQRDWYEALPEDEIFSRATAVEAGEDAGISPATAARLLKKEMLFKRLRQGQYERLW
jgi:hypothetical protein